MNTIEKTNLNVTPETQTVADLVRDAQAGDRDAFGQLFERYRPGIVALAMRRVRNADEAEELAQDVFIQAMQKIEQLRVPEAFGGWLRRIVHRMAINRMTRTRKAVPCDPETLEATCLAEVRLTKTLRTVSKLPLFVRASIAWAKWTKRP